MFVATALRLGVDDSPLLKQLGAAATAAGLDKGGKRKCTNGLEGEREQRDYGRGQAGRLLGSVKKGQLR